MKVNLVAYPEILLKRIHIIPYYWNTAKIYKIKMKVAHQTCLTRKMDFVRNILSYSFAGKLTIPI